MAELLLGAGSSRVKKLAWHGKDEWTDLVTLDFNADHKPDVVWDLENLPLPFEDNVFEEVHCFEVLEHLGGRQGDFRRFFAEWSEFWRILKPGGCFFGSTPHPSSPWAFGDPGHVRVIPPESFVFLNQPSYTEQVGKTPMSDYRFVFKGDFDILHLRTNEAQNTEFVLRAVKPSRISI